MKTLYFSFFHGKSLTSKIIEFFTRSNISHVGVVLDLDTLESIEVFPQKSGIINLINQKWNYTLIPQIHSKGTKITIIGIDVEDEKYDMAINFYKKIADQKIGYDWLGVIAFVIPMEITQKGKYFCSEGCMEGLKISGIVPKEIQPWQYNPEMFYEFLFGLNGKIVKQFIL